MGSSRSYVSLPGGPTCNGQPPNQA
jgi:hypothetical protein